MKTKFIAAYIRRNIDNKNDYLSFYSYSTGEAVTFDNAADALEKARAICADDSCACYSPTAIPV